MHLDIFRCYPQQLPVVILGLDFISMIATCPNPNDTEIMIRMLSTSEPNSVPLKELWVNENYIRQERSNNYLKDLRSYVGKNGVGVSVDSVIIFKHLDKDGNEASALSNSISHIDTRS